MAKALGIGGIFFKSSDPNKLGQWYERWLGLTLESGSAVAIFKPEALPKTGYGVWSPFPGDTDYFSPSGKDFMINLVVDDLEGALKQVQAGGAQLAGQIQNLEYGLFGWFVDPDGNKVELWQPPTS
jgi:predicted enzyme related to lactoylglutathione lyase